VRFSILSPSPGLTRRSRRNRKSVPPFLGARVKPGHEEKKCTAVLLLASGFFRPEACSGQPLRKKGDGAPEARHSLCVRLLVEGRRGASRRTIAASFRNPGTVLPLAGGALVRAPIPGISPVRRTPCSHPRQPVIVPADGDPRPPERRACLRHARGAASRSATRSLLEAPLRRAACRYISALIYLTIVAHEVG
jgi:hypothetical protein